MKKLIILSKCFLLLAAISSCNTEAQQQNVAQMLKDSVKREEIFNAIYNDSIHLEQFMAYMMKSNSDVMSKHQVMMNMMMTDTSMCKMTMGNMMDKMAKDSSICKRMCVEMMNNEHIKMMMQSMNQRKNNVMNDGMGCPTPGKMNMDGIEKTK